VDLQLHTGRSLDVVTQAETIAPFGESIVDDYARYTSGAAILEMADRLVSEEREPALRMYLLLTGALRALAEGAHDPGLVLDAFGLRALAVSGYAPSLGDCARCGRVGPHRWFAVGSGGAVCGDCRPAGAATPAVETVALLAALLEGDWAVADVSERRHRREASGLIAASLQWHLEQGLRSLRLVERT
jgi:DNA repair protein RecO (recombination protein O)